MQILVEYVRYKYKVYAEINNIQHGLYTSHIISIIKCNGKSTTERRYISSPKEEKDNFIQVVGGRISCTPTSGCDHINSTQRLVYEYSPYGIHSIEGVEGKNFEGIDVNYIEGNLTNLTTYVYNEEHGIRVRFEETDELKIISVKVIKESDPVATSVIEIPSDEKIYDENLKKCVYVENNKLVMDWVDISLMYGINPPTPIENKFNNPDLNKLVDLVGAYWNI